jgi:hypothetical protein
MLAGRPIPDAAAAHPPPPAVLVGSTNRVKVAAVATAVKSLFPHLQHVDVRGAQSASGVADQPVGDEETLRGALNRVADMQRQAAAAALPPSKSSSGGSGGGGGGGKGAPAPWLLVAVEGGVVWRPAGDESAAAACALPSSRQQREEGAELYCFAWAVAKSPGSGAHLLARSAVGRFGLRNCVGSPDHTDDRQQQMY